MRQAGVQKARATLRHATQQARASKAETRVKKQRAEALCKERHGRLGLYDKRDRRIDIVASIGTWAGTGAR
ncbi:unnamed protein product, partial [Ilex paraguariensis]